MRVFTRLACASLLTFLPFWVAAQPTMSMPFLNNAQPNQNVNLPVNVTGFTNIVSMQFVISWNPQVLRFLTVDNFNLPLLGAAAFNVSKAVDSGYVRVVYEAVGNFNGVSVADMSDIFRMRFKVIGPINSSTPVCFTESYPTIMEIARKENDTTKFYNINTVGLDCGFVAVGFTVDSKTPNADAALPVKLFPNPFGESTKVEFDLQEAGDVSVEIVDITGKTVYQEKNWWALGQQAIVLDKSDFPSKGSYFLTIKTASQHCIRPLFLF
jgi:Secretion system C-terminal sorting domain/Cohesin domain